MRVRVRRGNNIVAVGLVAVGVRKLSMDMGFFSLVCCAFLIFFAGTRVCVCVCVCVMICAVMICATFLWCLVCCTM